MGVPWVRELLSWCVVTGVMYVRRHEHLVYHNLEFSRLGYALRSLAEFELERAATLPSSSCLRV